MSLLSRNSTWQTLGDPGRTDAVELGGKFLLGAGAVLTGTGVCQQTHGPVRAAIDAAGDAAISWGAAWASTQGGMEARGTIGSSVGPEGTLIGGGIGAVVGAGVGFFAGGQSNDLVGDIFG